MFDPCVTFSFSIGPYHMLKITYKMCAQYHVNISYKICQEVFYFIK